MPESKVRVTLSFDEAEFRLNVTVLDTWLVLMVYTSSVLAGYTDPMMISFSKK